MEKNLKAKVVSVATTQEEIGVRGATTAAHAVNPDVAIAVDVVCYYHGVLKQAW